ncbi:unnamed protein product [Adineta ricciae]|uniref:Phosphoribulokinase/uridine kinase domain-containing protein n=1 Tax=Adineta ricciae TaxID=249248 RepID=A0A814H9U7_ADIRI|nr:unnamed protein product [Adineta ricciae]
MSPEVIFIGIAGPSGCGKTTYAKHLVHRLQSPFIVIGLDDFFYCTKTIEHPILGRIRSFEEPETLHVESLVNLLQSLKQHPENVTRYRRGDISLTDKKYIYVVVEGFLLFGLSDKLTSMFDVRIFFDSNMAECRLRRFRRRSKIASQVPDDQVQVTTDFQQWFDYLVWEEYLKRRDLQMSKAEKIFHSDQYRNRDYTQLDDYLDARLIEIIEKK